MQKEGEISLLEYYKNKYNLTPKEFSETYSDFLFTYFNKKVPVIIDGNNIEVKIDKKEVEKLNLSIKEMSLMQTKLKEAFIEKARQKEYDIYSKKIGDIINCKITSINRGKYENTILRVDNFYKGITYEVNENNIRDSYSYYLLDKVEKKTGEDIGLFFVRDGGDSTRFIRAILEKTIPELKNLIEIVAIARKPGFKTKVIFKNRSTDLEDSPVKIARGHDGLRFKTIGEYLGYGLEKIEFIPFREELSQQIKVCLPEDSIHTMVIDPTNNTVEIVVREEEFLSKILGREGKNISLIGALISKRNQFLGIDNPGCFIKILTKHQYEEKKQEEEKEFVSFYNEEYGIELSQAKVLVNLINNNIDPIKSNSINDDTKRKYKNYLKNKLEDDRDEFVSEGGDPSLFLYKNLDSSVYFKLLKSNITRIEDLKKFDTFTLSDLTGLDMHTCVCLLSEE